MWHFCCVVVGRRLNLGGESDSAALFPASLPLSKAPDRTSHQTRLWLYWGGPGVNVCVDTIHSYFLFF